jgi:hypothetical protein
MAVLAQIPKFGLVLVLVVLRPRCAGVFCGEKSPIVPQLFCSIILIVKHPDFRGRGRRSLGLVWTYQSGAETG